MSNIPSRFRSRKFLVALLGQITGLAVLIAGPEHAETVEQVAQNGGALLLMGLTGLGYIMAEGKVDAERAKQVDPLTRSPLWALALLLPVVFITGGCETIQAKPAQIFVDSVGEEYLSYVETGLSPEQLQEIVEAPEQAAAVVAAPDLSELAITTRRTFVADFRAYVHRSVNAGHSRIFPALPGSVIGASDESDGDPREPDQ